MRTRLAPSPTGALHLGNARSFLLTWLAARAVRGEVVLRVEDLDGPRTKAGAVEQALDDLRWLGLDWDGEPLMQSTRVSVHTDALQALQAAGRVYPCVCTRKEIEAAQSAPNEGESRAYPGTCRGRFADAASAEATTGRAPAWRFRVEAGTLSWVDALRGPQTANPAEEEGDFVVAKKTGEAAYQLAVVVDDAFQEVDAVIRGDDLIPSTALQILLQDALGLPRPRYIHLPLVRGEDGRRLAKRHGDTRLALYREAGVAPERVLGLLAAWSGLGERAPVSAADLVDRFAARIPSSFLTGNSCSSERNPLAPASPGTRGVNAFEAAGIPLQDVVFTPADHVWLLGE